MSHGSGISPLDVFLICAVVGSLSMLGVTIVNGVFKDWDEGILLWFSDIVSTRTWSISWWFITMAWLAARIYLFEHYHWFRDWGDNVLITILFATNPTLVENAMKFSSKRQMDVITAQNSALANQTALIAQQNAHITDLTVAIREQLDRSEERDDLLHEMVSRLLDAIEQPGEGAHEVR